MEPIQFTVPVYGEGVFATLENRAGKLYDYYHRHSELQVTCVLQGNGTIVVGNIAQSFQQGDIFVLRPNEPHMFTEYEECGSSGEIVHLVHVFVHLERMEKLFVIPEFDQVGSYLIGLDASKKVQADRAQSLQSYFRALSEKNGIPKFIEFISLLHALTQHARDAESLYSGARKISYSDKDGARISAVYKYTFDHLQDDVAIADVASLVHMTPSSFCKFFKKHTTKTYVGFLNEVRIEKACQLLVNRSTESIAEAAFQVGFKNTVHFNRVFKQIMRLSPRHYLQQYGI
ncbi:MULTISPECIES: AraC family transcriptional regulator [Sphingobacterium]|uniref:AraC family transcriptional regulator n=1 Tax=Sphingobacterium populi TaxID=1812824 RepID=A0ABW5UAD0_9SPHI|nr:AraC family transcriptional regulator [Sphingobacterium sp. CFCC 11742]